MLLLGTDPMIAVKRHKCCSFLYPEKRTFWDRAKHTFFIPKCPHLPFWDIPKRLYTFWDNLLLIYDLRQRHYNKVFKVGKIEAMSTVYYRGGKGGIVA
jgi:hypothetical protein